MSFWEFPQNYRKFITKIADKSEATRTIQGLPEIPKNARKTTNCQQPLDPQTNIISTQITGTRSSIKLSELSFDCKIAKKELKYANHFRKSELTIFSIAIYSNQLD